MDVTYAGLSGLWFECWNAPFDQFVTPYFKHIVVVLCAQKNDRRTLAECLCRCRVRIASFECGIGCMGVRAQKCFKHLFLDALAAAYAETGRFNEAVFTVRRALKMTLLFGPNELVSGLKRRLRLYQDKRPYRQSAK